MNRALEGLLSGRTLGGRYAVHEVIGRGGMSLVYRAVDERLGREVALKIVSTPVEHSRDELRERFRREAAAAARIPPHPHVVQIYDYGTDPELDLDYIAMELLRGDDLKARLRTGPVPHDVVLRVVREAALGLAAGHRVGIVHRDVKPANIFLSASDGTVKILDFGIAKALEIGDNPELTRTGGLPHSPAYASPEQLAHQRHLTPASDVYQLGLVAYELLVGERPFWAAERERIQNGEEVPVPEHAGWSAVPAAERAVLARALATDPEGRFHDAAAFAAALSTVPAPAVSLEEEVVEEEDADETVLAVPALPEGPLASDPISEPPPAPTRGAPVARRSWGRLPQIVGGVVLALLGLLLITRLDGDPDDAPAPGVVAAEPAEDGEPAVAEGEAAVDEAEREFRPLVAEAAGRIEEEARSAGEENAAAVERVVVDVNQSWVEGDLDRHISHYADRVDYYTDATATRAEIRADRGGALEEYDDREITLGRRATEFTSPGRARVLVEKEWNFTGSGDARMSGAGRQQYLLELRDGEWKVVSEQLVEQYR